MGDKEFRWQIDAAYRMGAFIGVPVILLAVITLAAHGYLAEALPASVGLAAIVFSVARLNRLRKRDAHPPTRR